MIADVGFLARPTSTRVVAERAGRRGEVSKPAEGCPAKTEVDGSMVR